MTDHPATPPPGFDAVIFDMDGVVTQTAKLHARAWKQMFDSYLKGREKRHGEPFRPFDARSDYLQYVDGKPRYEGVRSFLDSRGIRLPGGSPSDPPDRETVCGLGNRKDRIIKEILRTKGVEVFPSTIDLIEQLKAHAIKVGIVSSSKNCKEILRLGGIDHLFDARVDGTVTEAMGLKGKPEPDIFIESARLLGVDPGRAAVVEDAISGVQAGRKAGFGLVLGVARSDNRKALEDNGADRVVSDLSEIGLSGLIEWFRPKTVSLPSALDQFGEVIKRMANKQAVVFLDHDGTLAPIADRPDLARMSDAMRETVGRLAGCCPTAVVSGRSLADIKGLVGIDRLFYAGNHGLEIAGPDGSITRQDTGKDFLPDIETAYHRLVRPVGTIPGAFVEHKTYSLSVHYRQALEEQVPEVEGLVDRVLNDLPRLRKHHGKKVFEIRPRIDWNKGKAVLWLLDALHLNHPEVLPFYVGDDATDEDAFRALAGRGIGVLVSETDRASAAEYSLRNTEEVGMFLNRLVDHIARRKR